jgi:hypothetical protein
VPYSDPQWVPISELSGRASDLVDHYLRSPKLTCCSFRAGYRIWIDGRWWLDSVDEFWMSMNWVRAVSDLLVEPPPQNDVQTFVWEESQLKLRREGEWLRLFDASSATMFPATWVPFRPFVRDLWLGARAFAQIAVEIDDELARRRGAMFERLDKFRQPDHVDIATASAQAESEKFTEIRNNFRRAVIDLQPLKSYLGTG